MRAPYRILQQTPPRTRLLAVAEHTTRRPPDLFHSPLVCRNRPPPHTRSPVVAVQTSRRRFDPTPPHPPHPPPLACPSLDASDAVVAFARGAVRGETADAAVGRPAIHHGQRCVARSTGARSLPQRNAARARATRAPDATATKALFPRTRRLRQRLCGIYWAEHWRRVGGRWPRVRVHEGITRPGRREEATGGFARSSP